MGTGIVGLGLHVDGRQGPADVLLAVAAVLWIALAVVVVRRAMVDRARLRAGARTPSGLTSVAATTVLGAGAVVLHWTGVGVGLLIVGSLAWMVLTPGVWRALPAATAGDAFMLTVAAEGLAVLAAVIAARDHAAWLATAAIAMAGIGIGVYPVVLMRFDRQTLRTGSGEQWIAGGALAISCLALAELALTAAGLPSLRGGRVPLRDTSLVLWAAAIGWLPALVAAEVRRPRLRYQVARWSTVFPLGMYAVCSMRLATATGTTAIRDFGRAWMWVAVAGWVLVFGGMVHRGARLWGGLTT